MSIFLLRGKSTLYASDSKLFFNDTVIKEIQNPAPTLFQYVFG